MTEKDILNSISSEVSNQTPVVIKKVLKKIKEEENSMVKNRKWKLAYGVLAAVVLCIIAGTFYGYNNYYKGVTTIDIDVNPSIELVLNKQDKVVELNALNEDGKTIVDEMDFIGSDYKVAVNALIGSMLRKGYITELNNSILLSVDGNEEIESSLMEYVDSIIAQSNLEAAVLAQTMSEDDNTIAEKVKEYGISTGKATLIQQIITADATQTWEKLSKLSINELNLIFDNSIAKIETVKTTGTASEKSYVGVSSAKSIALKHASLTSSKVSVIEADLDSENGIMVYEVEFYYNGYEYDYEINALTGEVVRNTKEYDDDYIADNDDDDDYESNTQTNETTSTTTNNSTNNNTTTTYISKTKAKTIALAHAGVSSTEAFDMDTEFDRENGIYVYEVDFETSTYEYEYVINAITGKIVNSNKNLQDND